MVQKFLSGSSLGAWLLTLPASAVGWYDNLSKIAASGSNIQNLDTVQNELISGRCLSMHQIPDTPHKFQLNAVACAERRRTICRLDPPAIAAPTKPPQFPCIKKGINSRRKRDIKQLDDGNR